MTFGIALRRYSFLFSCVELCTQNVSHDICYFHFHFADASRRSCSSVCRACRQLLNPMAVPCIAVFFVLYTRRSRCSLQSRFAVCKLLFLLPHRNQIQTPQTPVYFSKRAGNGGRGGRVRGESAPDSSAGSGRNEEICCRGVNV